MTNTSNKGKLLELKVLTRLFEKGYDIARPFGTQSGWDLLCWVDGKFQRIQVKTAKLRGIQKNRIYVDFLRSKDRIENKKNKKWTYKGYSRKEIDYIIAVKPQTFLMWIIPVEDIEHKRSVTFGLNDYRFNW